ncbi:DUF805 domain-containing protein [Methylobacterium sp. J-030]|uniref:DUF805 domain-containing protein n=1 Tax=Methylobacterium sp. J-030 TaxID=2836627 RepID=UPI001FB98DC5|nr:DUF805 domain-containing protein [Methylobacterium sp. J-030]MCJ2068595.1 DUF805 domain-containing protein [Methylobacterium sp. J-030]
MPPLFSFSGRVGRVTYILSTLALGVGAVVLAAGALFAIFGFLKGSGSHAPTGPALFLWLPLLVVLGFTCAWSHLTFQVRRLRDIGWNPWIVLGCWFAVCIFDAVLAHAMPAMALRNHHSTIIGMLCNLAIFGALWFWPGTEGDQSPGGTARLTDRIRYEPATEPLRPMAVDASARGRTGFGRRGAGGTVGV